MLNPPSSNNLTRSDSEEACLVVPTDFVHVSGVISDLLKEVQRRMQLRERLEAERGGSITDEEFIEIADRTGIKL